MRPLKQKISITIDEDILEKIKILAEDNSRYSRTQKNPLFGMTQKSANTVPFWITLQKQDLSVQHFWC